MYARLHGMLLICLKQLYRSVSEGKRENREWTVLCGIHVVSQIENCQLTTLENLFIIDSKALERQEVKFISQ